MIRSHLGVGLFFNLFFKKLISLQKIWHILESDPSSMKNVLDKT